VHPIIIHIGPPKTATTSLQYALQSIDRSDFVYGGMFQPRETQPIPFCADLYAICTDQEDTTKDPEKLRSEIKAICGNDKTLFLSEEMFLFASNKTPIRSRLSALRDTLSGLECRIVISARPGRAALPSYYQEIFSVLPLEQQVSFDAFCESPKAACYDYGAICDLLTEIGFHDICILDYREIVKDEFTLGDLTGREGHKGVKLALPKTNVGATGAKTSERDIPAVSARNLGRVKWIKSLLVALRLRRLPGYRQVVSLLSSVRLQSAGARALMVPDARADELDRSFETAFAKFGVRGTTHQQGS
jgi:hypothetical protein